METLAARKRPGPERIGGNVPANGIELSLDIYTERSLRAAARRLRARLRRLPGGRCRVSFDKKGRSGEFLVEAVRHRYTALVRAFSLAEALPIVARAKQRGFAPPPVDWPALMEPQVEEDRRRELASLLLEARRRLP